MPSTSPCPELAAPLGDVETERLLLRRFQPGDADLIAPVFATPEVWMFPYGRGFTFEETQRFVDRQIAEWDSFGVACWLAWSKEEGRAVGYVGLSVPHFLPDVLPALEVGWRFDPDVWGKGLASEGGRAALNQAFGPLGLDRVCSAPQVDNEPSCRVCERLGMRLEGEVTAPANARRAAVAISLYWVTRQDWAG